MKKGLILSSVVLVVLLALMGGCTQSIPVLGTDWDAAVSFSEQAVDALPDFNGGSRTISRAVTTWSLGDPIYELYYAFTSADASAGGYFNLYDLLDTADQRFTSLYTSGEEIADQAIDSPVDLGFTDGTKNVYNYVYSYDGALNDDPTYYSRTFGRNIDGVCHMLNSIRMDRDDEKNRSVIQAIYNESTEDLTLAMYMANYTDGGWEQVKVWAEGNTGTGVFLMKVIRDGFAYDHNFVAYGDSSGDSDYFLVKLANNTMDITSANFYTINATDSIDQLKLMDADGSATPQNDTQDYAAQIATIAAYTSADLPEQSALDGLLETPIAYTALTTAAAAE